MTGVKKQMGVEKNTVSNVVVKNDRFPVWIHSGVNLVVWRFPVWLCMFFIQTDILCNRNKKSLLRYFLSRPYDLLVKIKDIPIPGGQAKTRTENHRVYVYLVCGCLCISNGFFIKLQDTPGGDA